MSGYRGPQPPSQKLGQINLEALLEKPTVKEVMEELLRQSECPSREKLLDLLSMHDVSGKLVEESYSNLGKWFRRGNMPWQTAYAIEKAVGSMTGQSAPPHFLTRFYE